MKTIFFCIAYFLFACTFEEEVGFALVLADDCFLSNLIGSIIRPARFLISGWVSVLTALDAFHSSNCIVVCNVNGGVLLLG